jgi:hypothetical protein
VHAALGGGSSRADADALGAVGGSALVHGDLGTQRELSASSSAVGHEVLVGSVRLALASKESRTPSIVSGAPWRGGGDGTDFAERLGP